MAVAEMAVQPVMGRAMVGSPQAQMAAHQMLAAQMAARRMPVAQMLVPAAVPMPEAAEMLAHTCLQLGYRLRDVSWNDRMALGLKSLAITQTKYEATNESRRGI
jgi:hypothetical protein